jgi:hypothetical protein
MLRQEICVSLVDLRTINRTVTMKRILCLMTTLACSFSVLASNDATGSQNQTNRNKTTKNPSRSADAPKSGNRHVYKIVNGID